MTRVELEEALEAIEPRTRAARVREVMPVIERKLAAGVRLVDILTVFKTAGLEMSPATLRSYLYLSSNVGKSTLNHDLALTAQDNLAAVNALLFGQGKKP